MEGKNLEKVSGLTSRVIVIGLVISIVTMVLYEFNAFLIGGYGPGWAYCTGTVFGAFPWALSVLFIIGLISSRLKNKFSKQELTVLYSMLLLMSLMGVVANSTIGSAFLVTNPDFESVRPFFAGIIYTFPINIAYWASYVLSMYGCVFFFALVWRKEYVETEMLSFPTTVPALRIIESSVGETSIFNRFFVIGIVISLLTEALWSSGGGEGVSLIPSLLFDVGKVSVEWPASPFSFDLKAMFGLTEMVPLITWTPWVIGLFYLFPSRVLLTLWIVGFAFTIIMPPILILTNLMPSLPPDTYTSIKYFSWMYGPEVGVSIGLGGLLALGLVPFIFKWRYVLNTLRGKGSDTEPMPYKRVWLYFVICFVIWSALMSAAGVPFWVALSIAVFTLIMYMGWNRIYAEGWNNGFLWIANFSEYFGGLPSFFGGGSMDNVESRMSMFFGINTVDTVQASELGLNFLGPFSMANATGTNNKDILKVTILSLVIGLPIAIAFGMIIMNTYGFGGHWEDLDWPAWSTTPWFGYMSTVSTHTMAFIGGVIVVGIITWLSQTFPWFILSPAGLVIASNGYFLGLGGLGFWFVALIAWVIKLILTRSGGTKMVQKYQPFFIGLIIGKSIMLPIEIAWARIFHPATLPKWW